LFNTSFNPSDDVNETGCCLSVYVKLQTEFYAGGLVKMHKCNLHVLKTHSVVCAQIMMSCITEVLHNIIHWRVHEKKCKTHKCWRVNATPEGLRCWHTDSLTKHWKCNYI